MTHEIDERIARAMNDIRSETAFEGRLGPPRPLAERLASCHTPGMGLSIVEGFDLVWAGGFGRREAGSDDPVTAFTLFQWWDCLFANKIQRSPGQRFFQSLYKSTNILGEISGRWWAGAGAGLDVW